MGKEHELKDMRVNFQLWKWQRVEHFKALLGNVPSIYNILRVTLFILSKYLTNTPISQILTQFNFLITNTPSNSAEERRKSVIYSSHKGRVNGTNLAEVERKIGIYSSHMDPVVDLNSVEVGNGMQIL